MLSREEVAAAYQYLLGRLPENEDVIVHHQNHESLAALRQEIMQSAEFEMLYQQIAEDISEPLGSETLAPISPIETEASGSTREEMWARVAQNWRQLGEDAPHWSVLTLEKFRPESIDANRDAFRESGALDMAVVDAALERLPDGDALRAGLCIEVGCGVGRATRGLSERFSRVLAVDVSAPHLEIAKADLTASGHSNVDYRCMKRIEDYADLEAPNFFFSRIVLQHNPPPVQVAILRSILGNLATPGAALFQVITHISDYRFDAEQYLAGDHVGMEMHAVPQSVLFSILQQAELDVVEIDRDDTVVGDPRYRSHMVLARKPS